MDPGEALFKGLLRLWKRVRGGPDGPRPGSMALDAVSPRLELFGALLLGYVPEVKAAGGAGGLESPTLLLPRRVELFDARDDNTLVYLYRVAFAAAARSTGLDAGCGGDAVGALASLLAVPAILERLHDEYPGAEQWTRHLAGAARAARPPVPGGTTTALAEELLRERLRIAAAAPPEASPLSGRAAGWLRSALAVEPRDASALRSAAEQSWSRLRRVVDLGSDPLPQTCIWGRLWPPRTDGHEIAESSASKTNPAPHDRRVIELGKTIRLERSKLGEREDKPLFHVFEKLETAEEYRGQSASPDSSGNVEHMRDAIEELRLGTAIRTTDDPRNLVRAEVLVEPSGLEIAERVEPIDGRVFRYPEWHHKRERYRDDWVTVVEERYVAGGSAVSNSMAAREVLRGQRRHVEDIRAHLVRALVRRRRRDRQPDGPEIDLNAIVDRHADLVAGRTPSDRLYIGARRALRDIAILVLVDTSYSTDGWLEGRRVLDVEIESLLVLSAALEGVMDEEVAVMSFRSHTRNDVRLGVVKGFDDSWAHLRRVAPGLHAEGYTRIGAAIRHSTRVLDEARARKKLLLIVSDGKPTDYDRYEGRHGVEDVARAVREAAQRRVRCFGLAVESEAKVHLARMLGPGRYRILPRTSLLPSVMADVFLGMLTD